VWNVYGPTETTVWSALRRVNGVDGTAAATLTVPVGRPLDNTEIFLLDVRGSRCRWASPASCTSAAMGSPAATWGAPTHGGAFRSRSLRRRPALSHRRPRPLPPRWQRRLSRSHRSPGQGARFPHRAGGGRGGAPQAARGAGGGGRGARGPARGPPVGRLCRGSGEGRLPRGGRAARGFGRRAAALHGAGRLRRPRPAALDRERQDRPAGPAARRPGALPTT